MSEWLPIESAPKSERILLFYPAQRGLPDRIHICDDWSEVEPTRTFFKPSHWMPLPPAPEDI